MIGQHDTPFARGKTNFVLELARGQIRLPLRLIRVSLTDEDAVEPVLQLAVFCHYAA